MRLLLLLACIVVTVNAAAQGSITLQDKPFVYQEAVDTTILNFLYKDRVFQRMTKPEQEMFYWTNVFRKDPVRFFNNVVKEFIRQFPEANKSEVKSLERDLFKFKSALPLLLPDVGLYTMSQTHSADLKKRGGVISHNSSTGKDFVQRIKEVGSYKCGAENLFLGNNNPLEALVMLLIDYGVTDKGHRLNLLDPTFGRMGISVAEISPKKATIVQVFACK
jgi:Cysteine-rich secretory protein family